MKPAEKKMAKMAAVLEPASTAAAVVGERAG
jgi:hypothetical protein